MGERGLGYAQFAREFGVSRSMLYRYRTAHPEFAEALAWARDLSVAHWTDRLATATGDRNANAQLMMFLLANLFPDDFKLKRDVTVSGDANAPLVVKAAQARSLPREELLRLATEAVLEMDAPSHDPAPAPVLIESGKLGT
jgi:hypothetical protein